MKRVAHLILGTIVGVGLTLTIAPALGAGTVHGPGSNPPNWMTVACPTEDSAACYWDASVQGDHNGNSFYSIVFDRGTPSARNCIAFWDKDYGISHNRCFPMP